MIALNFLNVQQISKVARKAFIFLTPSTQTFCMTISVTELNKIVIFTSQQGKVKVLSNCKFFKAFKALQKKTYYHRDFFTLLVKPLKTSLRNFKPFKSFRKKLLSFCLL